jgi:hypothetical protein
VRADLILILFCAQTPFLFRHRTATLFVRVLTTSCWGFHAVGVFIRRRDAQLPRIRAGHGAGSAGVCQRARYDERPVVGGGTAPADVVRESREAACGCAAIDAQ